MDLHTLWLTNRSLLDNMSDNEYSFKENEIIKAFFGGTKNMIVLILKNQDNLSYVEQNKLLKILKKTVPKEIVSTKIGNSIAQELKSNDQKRSVILCDLHQHCISHIFQFLNSVESRAFSHTSRNICLASKSKNCHPNADILCSPTSKMYHFIHKISELENITEDKNSLSKFMHAIQSLSKWVNNHHDNYLSVNINLFAESGLLLTFSDLLSDQNIIDNHVNLIKNILFLLNSMSMVTDVVHFLNANIIEALASFTKNNIHKNDEFFRTKTIPYIVCVISRLYYSDSSFASAISSRVFNSEIIQYFVSILEEAWSTKCNTNLEWIDSAISLIGDWIFIQPFDDYSQDHAYVSHAAYNIIIPRFMNKISKLIDIQHTKTWIYELLSKHQIVIVRDPIDQASHDDNYFYRFTISEIVTLPSQNDTNQMVTLIGKFNRYDLDTICTNPNQKISVPIDHIHCDRTPDENKNRIHHDLMQTFRSVCQLMLNYSYCYHEHIDFKSSNYQTISDQIKYILQTSRDQFPRHSTENILFSLLRTDWTFFVSLIAEEIEIEFNNMSSKAMYILMDIAWNANKLDNLCQMQWFRERFSNIDWSIFPQDLDELPEHWDNLMLIGILRNFYDQTDAYVLLKQVFKKLQLKNNVGLIKMFTESGGAQWLLTIITHSLPDLSQVLRRNLSTYLLWRSQEILGNIFFHLPCLSLRNNFLKAMVKTCDTDKPMLKLIWWNVLQKGVLIDNQNDEENMKLVLEQMNWFVNEYGTLQLAHYDNFRELLVKLCSQQYKCQQIRTCLQNIISIIGIH